MTARERVAKAFRRAYESAGLSQEALSKTTGIKQTTISKYARGEVMAPLEVLEKVDAACRRPRGHVLRLAGFVDDEKPDVLAAIEADAELSDPDRDALLFLYNFLKRR